MVLVLYCTTVFVSAGLLFWIQPLVGKLVLPRLGGTPETWNTCMVFFQAALLAGYGYAHWTIRRFGVRRQAVLHCLFILLPLVTLPIGIADEATPPADRAPIGWLLALLALSIGAPLLAVTTTAPLLQRWFAETRHMHAGDPYFLYSASNLGSMLSLAAFPLLMEPSLRLSQQTWWWSLGYGVLVLLVVACGVVMLRSWPAGTEVDSITSTTRHAVRVRDIKPVDARRRLSWVALSFVGSSWLLGVTAYLTTDIAPVPLLWVIPLALYLASFIVVFARRPWIPHAALVRYFPLALLLLVGPIVFSNSRAALGLHLSVFFWGLLVCHGELARDRPQTSHLTEYYLWMSLGGVLGGMLNGLVAPLVFRWHLEYPLTIALAGWMTAASAGDVLRSRATLGRLLALGGITLLLGLMIQRYPTERPFWLVTAAVVALPILAVLFVLGRPKLFCAVLTACLVASEIAAPFYGDVLFTGRGYFGVHRVVANRDEKGEVYHHLVHGSTVHGRQARSTGRRCEPLTYYHRSGPLGDVFAALPDGIERRVAIVGLGTGAMVSYARAGDEFTFYEIDPLVQQIAETPEYFSFLRDCSAGSYRIVLGDGRRQLAAATEAYDAIIFDAFSSDAVPIHLLTREAIAMYETRLAPRGVLVFHASNAHLDLASVLAALAAELKLACLVREDVRLTLEEFRAGKASSTYVVLTRELESFGKLKLNPQWVQPRPARDFPLWTDDFSNILGALRRSAAAP